MTDLITDIAYSGLPHNYKESQLGHSDLVDLCIDVGKKFDKNKPRFSLVPIESLEEIIKVLEYGANKYGYDNWKLVEPHERYYDAAFRHLFAWKKGELNDDETNLSHLAHAAACLLFLIYFEKQKENPYDT